MVNKRKQQDAAVLEELERTVFQDFTAAANSISQLYASAEAQRRITFHAGEQHGLEKVRQWIFARQGEGLPVTEGEIITYLQNELGYTTGEAAMPPTSNSDQAPSTNMPMPISGTTVQNFHIPQGIKQTKTCGLTSAPSSSSMGSSSLHIAQGGFWVDSNVQVPQIGSIQMPAGNCLHLNQEENASDSLDSAMDMSTEEHSNQHFS